MNSIRSFVRSRWSSQRGMSIMEVMIAAVLSGIVITAALNFYVAQHHQWLMQTDVSDVQQCARACLDDIAGHLRMAGYRLENHPAFAIGTDSLVIYQRPGTDVDTIHYFVFRPDTLNPVLVRQLPGESPQVYADGVEQLTIETVSGSLLRLSLTARAQRIEEELLGGDGYRRRQLSTDVRVRNLALAGV